MTLLTLILKITGLLNISALRKNKKDDKVVRFSINGNSKKPTNKAKKLSKLKKTLKSQNLSKSRKLFRFATKKTGLSFLTLDTRIAFNYLQLAFIKALIP